MFDLQRCVETLCGTKLAFEEAVASVPKRPGLYALHGEAGAWNQLGLGSPPDERPLYIGKSERSLFERPMGQHFGWRPNARARGTSITGYSSPRRSLAALLAK